MNINKLNFEGCEKTFSVLKVDAVCSSEMSMNFCQTTWPHTLEGSTQYMQFTLHKLVQQKIAGNFHDRFYSTIQHKTYPFRNYYVRTSSSVFSEESHFPVKCVLFAHL
jgi:hypothetical protein